MFHLFLRLPPLALSFQQPPQTYFGFGFDRRPSLDRFIWKWQQPVFSLTFLHSHHLSIPTIPVRRRAIFRFTIANFMRVSNDRFLKLLSRKSPNTCWYSSFRSLGISGSSLYTSLFPSILTKQRLDRNTPECGRGSDSVSSVKASTLTYSSPS